MNDFETFKKHTQNLPLAEGIQAAHLADNFMKVTDGELESADLLQNDAEAGNSSLIYLAARSVINDYMGTSQSHIVPKVKPNIEISTTDLEALGVTNHGGKPLVAPTESTKMVTFSNIATKKSFRLLDTIFPLNKTNPETGETHSGYGRILRLTSLED